MANEAKEKKKIKRPTALKRDIQSKKRRVRNRTFKSQVRTMVRDYEEILAKGDKEAIKATLNEVYSIMDKGVKKGVFKLNKASRTKARMAARAAKV